MELNRRHKYLIAEILHLLCIAAFAVAVTILNEWIFRDNAAQTFDFIAHRFLQFGLETVFVLLVLLLLYAAVRRTDVSALAGGLFFVLTAAVSYNKAVTRCEPFVPWDLTVLKDAVKIANRLKIVITPMMVAGLLFVLGCAALLFFLSRRYRPRRLRPAVRAGTTLVLAAAIPLYTYAVCINPVFLQRHGITRILWSQVDNYKRNGNIYTFLNNLGYRTVAAPANYGRETVDQAAGQIKRLPSGSLKPNIIIIQDESFCDLSLFEDVRFASELTPTFNSLKARCISGYAVTPMYGGGTCNSEFEALTGFSYSYLPAGSTPYQVYFNRPTFSYASFLKGEGYSTVAIHSFDRNFWERDKVFKNIGFDRFIASDNFKNPEMRRGFISDLETAKMVVKAYEENKKTGKPFFNFTITMQNHFSWDRNDYPASERVSLKAPSLTQDERDTLVSYATGVRDADAALKYIIDYFSKVGEPTIVVFYGDHMPAFNEDMLKACGYLKGEDSPENILKLHATPYLIWSNFEHPHEESATLSMYELAPYLTKCFNLQRPLYFDYLLGQFDTYRGYATGLFITPGNRPSLEMPAGGRYYYDRHFLFEYDLLIGNQYGMVLTK